MINLRSKIKEEHAVAIVYVVSLFMASMDSNIVNVALATLARQFHVPTSSVQWIVTGYLLSLAVFIPASGWFGDRFGTKRILLIAIFTFTFASFLCAISTTITQLTIFRVFQGVGGGLLTPVGASMLYRAFPPERRASIQPTLGLATIVAPATGPVIGGYFVTKLNWHWIFLVNLPIGAISLIFGALFLTEHRERPDARFDLAGFVLAGGGLAAVIYSLNQGPIRGWGSSIVVISATIGLVSLVIFVRVELRSAHPMLKLRLFRDQAFRISSVITAFANGSFQGILLLSPLFLQEVKGYTGLEAGLAALPLTLGVMCSAQTVRKTYHIFGPRRTISFGLALMVVMLVVFAFNAQGASPWTIRGMLFCLGLGVGQSNIPVNISAFANITPADTGHGSALFNMIRRASPALSVALLTTVLASTDHHRLIPNLFAFKIAFIACAAIGIGGSVTALFLRNEYVESTMKPRAKREKQIAGAE
jgi:EmrB/QacA subfamily drug resistance transporter